VGFLELLDPADRSALAGRGQARTFHPGETVMRQGDAADSVVVLLDGHVKVVASTTDGRSVVHAIYGSSDVVGEFEAIGDHPVRAASVIAVDIVQARVLARDEYLGYLLAHPRAALALARVLIRRLGAADRRRIAATSVGAAQALAHYLLDLVEGARERRANPTELDVPLVQDELASLLALSRNSLVRALGSLRARGLIATHRRTITVIDEAGLRRFAEGDRADP
jgi:CRP-like cAMP-binding protein